METNEVVTQSAVAESVPQESQSVPESPIGTPSVSEPVSATAEVPEAAVESAPEEIPAEEVPANADWIKPVQFIHAEWFQKLTHDEKALALEFWRTGSRLAAVMSVCGYEGDLARLATCIFDKGNLSVAIDKITGRSERDRVIAAIARAVKSRKATPANVMALELQAKILGII